jgi:small neutral amino acid transporter SnatA (MarC family)
MTPRQHRTTAPMRAASDSAACSMVVILAIVAIVVVLLVFDANVLRTLGETRLQIGRTILRPRRVGSGDQT